MEENKNNALEKARALQRSPEKEKKQPAKKKPKTSLQKRRELLEKKREERQRANAEKKLELERIKAHKEAEKEKAKNARKREKQKLIASRKQQKEQLKAERLKRKEFLQNESRKDREKRLKEEREERQALRRSQAQERKHKRELKAKERQKRRERNRGLGGWVTAVVTLGIATLVLSSVLMYDFLMPTQSDQTLEASYQRSFYDTVEHVENMDLNLSKFFASKDNSAKQLYLVDTFVNAELAENDLGQLPLQDESKFYTTKLVNQVGDYTKYLNKKLVNGESLTDEEMASLMQLYEANKTLKNSLVEMMGEMGNDFSFATLNEEGNVVTEKFNNLQNLSVNYPELIYDGPFSDGINDRVVKGLSGASINSNQAQDIFNERFAEYGLENVKIDGEASGYIECYNVSGEKDGELLFSQISKTGGKLIMFSYAGSCKEMNIDQADAIDNALKFIAQEGLENMSPVWVNFAHNVYTINFAVEKDGVIFYGDLIKVRVCAETGKVIGYEASSYYTNHTERVISKPSLTSEQAREKVSNNIEIDTVRLCLVPIGTSSEKLCYEFSGSYDGSIYYAYIDALNGKQLELFMVIEGSEGSLLM